MAFTSSGEGLKCFQWESLVFSVEISPHSFFILISAAGSVGPSYPTSPTLSHSENVSVAASSVASWLDEVDQMEYIGEHDLDLESGHRKLQCLSR